VGLNLKAKFTRREVFGFKTLKYLEIALSPTLGRLSEPEYLHRFRWRTVKSLQCLFLLKDDDAYLPVIAVQPMSLSGRLRAASDGLLVIVYARWGILSFLRLAVFLG